MTKIPQKVRCVNTKTGRVKRIAEPITKRPFFRNQGWMVQELEDGEEESTVTDKPPKVEGKLIDVDARRAEAQRLADEEAARKAEEERLAAEAEAERLADEEAEEERLAAEAEKEEAKNSQDEIEKEQFKADLVSIKGIGTKSADDIIEIYENRTNLLEAVNSKDDLPFTSDIKKALEAAYKN